MINKLLTRLLEEVKKNGVEYGLCDVVNNMWFNNKISLRSNDILKKYIRSNRPSYRYNPNYGWRKGALHPRIKWLKEHILLTQ